MHGNRWEFFPTLDPDISRTKRASPKIHSPINSACKTTLNRHQTHASRPSVKKSIFWHFQFYLVCGRPDHPHDSKYTKGTTASNSPLDKKNRIEKYPSVRAVALSRTDGRTDGEPAFDFPHTEKKNFWKKKCLKKKRSKKEKKEKRMKHVSLRWSTLNAFFVSFNKNAHPFEL